MPNIFHSDNEIFDRKSVKLHRDRAASHLSSYDFLYSKFADLLADCLSDVRRDFEIALDVGCHTGQIARALDGRGGIKTLLQCDISKAMIDRAVGYRVVADEELLPFRRASLDLILSCLSLHWVNDLPGTLIQMRQALKPDGLLLVALFGGQTLNELRQSLLVAEDEILKGASPRVSPFMDIREGGTLLQRAGFAMPVLDTNIFTVFYESPFKLMHDLRGMGEQIPLYSKQKTFTRREIFLRGAEVYKDNFSNTEGFISATFEVITFMAWAPAPNQPKPKKLGAEQIKSLKIRNNDRFTG